MEGSSLAPGANFELPFVLHANKLGERELCLLFTFREVRNVSPDIAYVIPLTPVSREMVMHFTASRLHVRLKSAPYSQRRWHLNRGER